MKSFALKTWILSFVLGVLPTGAAWAKKIVIAHRGASGYLPEHTLPAVAMAHAWGVDYVEPDVILTADDQAIVMHDILLDLTTDVARVFPGRARADGRYYAVDFTWAEIRQLRASERIDFGTGKPAFPNRFPSLPIDFKVPSLDEYLDLVAGLNKSTGREVGVYLEIKQPRFHAQEGKDITKIVMAKLAAHGLDRAGAKVVIQCFEPETLVRLRKEFQSPLTLVQLIGSNGPGEPTDFDAMRTQDGLKHVATYADGIGPALEHLFERPTTPNEKPRVSPLVAWAHENHLVVHPYTARADQVPPPLKSFEELLYAVYVAADADGVFTDFGDRAKAFLATLPPKP